MGWFHRPTHLDGVQGGSDEAASFMDDHRNASLINPSEVLSFGG